MVDVRPGQVDVLIVGGGIAGLALAVALGDRDLSVVVLEARSVDENYTPAGAGVADFDARVSALTPRSMAFLDALGAWPRIEAIRHGPYRHMTVWDAEGTGRIDFDAAEVGADSLGSIVENRLITSALADRVRDLRHVAIVQPAALAALSRREGGVEVSLEDGQCWHCALLVGADGALSRTRELLELRTREWDYGHRAIVTTARFERAHELTAWQRFLPSGPLALLPLPAAQRDLCSIVWSIDDERADDLLRLEDAGFATALSEASEHCLGAVLECSPRAAFPLRQRHAVDYVQENAALVADAAHTIHPLAGQGINLGLADVEILAEEVLRATDRGLAPGRLDVLRRYQRRRKADNLAMMAAMDGFKHLFGQPSPAIRWLRNTGMRGVGALPALKRRIIREAMGVAG